MKIEIRRFARLLILASLLLAFRADAETIDLDLYRYCAPGTNCGHASLADYDQFICETVQRVNVIWKPTGISFRPNLLPVDSTSPADPSGLPTGISKYHEVAGCRASEVHGDARVFWREQVAEANPLAISMMLTKGPNRCCSGIPRSWKDLDDQFGVFL